MIGCEGNPVHNHIECHIGYELGNGILIADIAAYDLHRRRQGSRGLASIEQYRINAALDGQLNASRTDDAGATDAGAFKRTSQFDRTR